MWFSRLLQLKCLVRWQLLPARTTAPDATGPGSVFPNFALGFGGGIIKPWFWGCLFPVGFSYWFLHVFKEGAAFQALGETTRDKV